MSSVSSPPFGIPKLVWTGSATTVAMADLDKGGKGWYIVGNGSVSFMVFVVDEAISAYGTARYTAFGVEFCSYAAAAGNFHYEREGTDLTITEIYKVG